MAGTRPLPPHATIRATVSGAMPGGGNWASVFWCFANSGATSFNASDLTSWLTSFYTQYTTHLKPIVPTDVTITLSKAIFYEPDGSAISVEASHTDTGSLAGTMLPDQVSSVLSWKMLPTWRGGKPRTYMPGVVSSELADNAHLSSTAQGARAGAGQGFRTGVNSTTIGVGAYAVQLGTVSFFSGNAPRSPAIFIGYTDCSVHSRLDTMRRRLGREV